MSVIQSSAWTAAVDYMRVSHPEGEECEKVVMAWYQAQRVVAGRQGGGARAARWRWMGYDGVSWGGVSVGRGAHGALCQASGVAAAELFDLRVPWRGCSRLDLQVTFWYATDAQWMAKGLADLADHARAHTGTRPYKVRLIDGHGDGDTLYLGARGKETKFIRVYDKWRQSGREDAWRYAWRWEVELTDGHARYALRTLEDWGQSEHSVASLVAAYLGEKGLTMPDTGTELMLPASKIPRPPTDDERRLRWLAEQVRPSIDKLIAGGVSSEDIRRLLGLSDHRL